MPEEDAMRELADKFGVEVMFAIQMATMLLLLLLKMVSKWLTWMKKKCIKI